MDRFTMRNGDKAIVYGKILGGYYARINAYVLNEIFN